MGRAVSHFERECTVGGPQEGALPKVLLVAVAMRHEGIGVVAAHLLALIPGHKNSVGVESVFKSIFSQKGQPSQDEYSC